MYMLIHARCAPLGEKLGVAHTPAHTRCIVEMLRQRAVRLGLSGLELPASGLAYANMDSGVQYEGRCTLEYTLHVGVKPLLIGRRRTRGKGALVNAKRRTH